LKRAGAWFPIGLLAALPPLFWSGNFVLARALHEDIPPIALSFWRWVGALAILMPFTWHRLWQHRDALRRHWVVLSLLALLGITNFNTFAYLGLQHTTATNGVLLSSATPVLIVGLSFLMLGTKVRARQLVGIFLSLFGVVLIATEGAPQRLAALTLNRGDIWILVAAVDWALYSVLLRWRPDELAPEVFLTALVALGLVPLAGLYGWELARGHGFALNATNFAAIGYVAIFPSVLAYVFWDRAVNELGPNRTGHYLHLMPAFGALLAVALLGERLHGFHLAGALLIAGGIVLATWAVSAPPRQRARSRSDPGSGSDDPRGK
jgi:drug/metabolite transporter (DMT)-like permease